MNINFHFLSKFFIIQKKELVWMLTVHQFKTSDSLPLKCLVLIKNATKHGYLHLHVIPVKFMK